MGDTEFRASSEWRDPDDWKSAGGSPRARQQGRASRVAPTLLSPRSAPRRAPAPHHRGPRLPGARVWEGAAIWAGFGRPWGSDCMRNLRNGAPSHRASDNRPLAWERRARSRCRPAPEFDRKGAGPSGACVRTAPIGSHEAPAR